MRKYETKESKLMIIEYKVIYCTQITVNKRITQQAKLRQIRANPT